MKILKIVAVTLLAVVVIAVIAFQFRTDPIAMLPGKRLSGEEQPYPGDWSFSDEFMTIAVETRLDDPHSVTTICFVHEGELYVPAQSGSTKNWTKYVLADPRIRLKMGGSVFPARATRVTDLSVEEVESSIVVKYPSFAERDPAEAPEDVWLFRISAR